MKNGILHILNVCTNLPAEVRLQPGARVMFLTNDMIMQGICNGNVGVVISGDLQAEHVSATITFLGIGCLMQWSHLKRHILPLMV